MKSVILAAVVALTAAPLAAQTAPAPAPAHTHTHTHMHTAPAVATPAAPATAGPATADTARFTLDTPLETIAADPAAKAVLDADLANITAHPMYDQFKAMSLNQVQPMSQGALTDEALAKVKIALAAIK